MAGDKWRSAFLRGLGRAAACIFPFIVFFAMGQGVVIWVVDPLTGSYGNGII